MDFTSAIDNLGNTEIEKFRVSHLSIGVLRTGSVLSQDREVRRIDR